MVDREEYISRRIFELTKSNLDATKLPCGPYLHPEHVFASMRMFRIDRLAAFWKNANGSLADTDLSSRVEDVVSGLSGSKTPWLFIMRGSDRGVSCGYGVGDVAQVRGIESSLAGSVLTGGWDPIADGWHPVRSRTLVLTGVPSRKNDNLERLSRALVGSDWLYTVYARPIERTVVHSDNAKLDRELSKCVKQLYIKVRFLAPTERLIGLIEKQQARYENARVLGFWQVHCSIAIEDEFRLPAINGLFQGAFVGRESTPEPVRVRRIDEEDPQDANSWNELTTAECATLATPLREDQPGFGVVPDTRLGFRLTVLLAIESTSVWLLTVIMQPVTC